MTAKALTLWAGAMTAVLGLRVSSAGEARPCDLVNRSDPYVIKVGYTTFESPSAVRTSSTLHSVGQYLTLVSCESYGGTWRRPLQFDLTLGNYYQIWSWFRKGHIDAAIVSPFMAMLLERDAQAISVLEFAEYSPRGDYAGHRPLMTASGKWRNDPESGLAEYLGALLVAAQAGAPESAAPEETAGLGAYRMNLIAHLSSSGFVMPTLYAKAWLDARTDHEKAVDLEVQRRFWQLYFERIRLTLAHNIQPTSEDVTDFYFSYDGRDPQRLKEDAESNGLGEWRLYAVPPFGREQPSIPNDVLVIRRQVAEEAIGTKGVDQAALAEELTAPRLQEPFAGSTGGYYRVRWFNPSIHGPFRTQVERLFSRRTDNPELARLNERWFERERFDFTVDEILAFLRQDQENSGTARLSLVLSGGGVKSLYQTVLLDYLYGLQPEDSKQLRNFDEAPQGSVGPTPRNTRGPLTVHNIIGTSGGAMLAFFAAQLPDTGDLTALLSRTAAKPLFPPTDLPRLLSVFILLIVLFTVLSIAKAMNVWGLGRDAAVAISEPMPRGLVVLYCALAVGGAAAITVTRSSDIEAVPGIEGALYVLTALLLHFGLTCIALGDAPRRQPVLARLGILGVICGTQLLMVACAARYVLDSADGSTHAPAMPPLSILASAGVCLIAAAMATVAAAGGWGLRLHALIDYASGMTAIVIFIATCYAGIGALTALGLGSDLELTPHFWRTLAVGGLLTSVAVTSGAQILRRRGKPLLHNGLVALVRDRRGAFSFTMAFGLTIVSGVCIACWAMIVAPAIYGNVPALRALRQAIPEEELWRNRFRSNLVVTGTLLSDTNCGQETGVIRSGGLYFCFEGPEGCGPSRGGSWQVFRRPAAARAVDAVFASGSAFPVFPPHRTHLPNGCEVRLVDGGYAHNVPLEAAALSAARQVLILNASPDPIDAPSLPPSGWRRLARQFRLEGSQLLRYAPDLLGFMYARAQELDRSIGANLVVASLTPRPADGVWPFLLDFRPSVRQRMIETATDDIASKHRIGHVLNWGLPLTAARIDYIEGRLPLPPRGWSTEIQERLDGIIREGRPGSVAAFDLDNTSLRGDIGDAMFLKTIVEFRYHGELPEFWDLFSEISARRELQNYWKRFVTQPRRSYVKPVEWDGDFADYVVLFYRQYERLLAQTDGPRSAYPWVVQMLVGMEPTDAAALAEEVWADEMNRPVGTISIPSQRFGTLTIDGGVRPRREMRELIARLQDARWKVWIVTASNAYVGRVAGRRLGVPAEQVLGIELTADATTGRLTARVKAPVPYREGKRKALLARGLRPILALGDSPTDLDMLDLAKTAIVIDRGRIGKGDLEKRPTLLLQPPESLRTETIR